MAQGTVKMLSPAAGASWFDHGFTSPTYVRPLRFNLERMQNY